MADYKRRVRIEGKPEDVAGYMLTVKDAKTGEDVTNVASVVIKLNPTQVNVADITYIEPDDHAQGRFVRVVAPSDNPEVSLTAFETFTDVQKFASRILDLIAEKEPDATTIERINILCTEQMEPQ